MTTVYEALGTIYSKCCGNCQHWDKAGGPAEAHGNCALNTAPVNLGTSDYSLWNPMLTLDLSLCSKWQQKDKAE